MWVSCFYRPFSRYTLYLARSLKWYKSSLSLATYSPYKHSFKVGHYLLVLGEMCVLGSPL